jgi:hypothetical protein
MKSESEYVYQESMLVHDSVVRSYVHFADRSYFYQFDPKRHCWQVVQSPTPKLIGRWYIKDWKEIKIC